ncbi:hypothetical protein C7448_11241 [Tenacibaculum gallaicum]|uniref:Uncharacterized protein n=1 Tax=Tenacibaculum gallaicum TaxID=561505 RepID=A0A3E0HF77_9FLAO|nr:hypothetical protein [Tenacibaculum gallaicum]REH43934.1 hypothetical protein C7448_11241 [Tenacibaculum gallaicum]
MIKQLLKSLTLTPKKLFLIDGLGAVISTFLLGVVLVNFESIIGIPPSTLYLLAVLPIFFTIYDFYSYQKTYNELKPFLKGIAILNLLYCCLSIGVAFYHFKTITSIGWGYILVEVSIIIILSIVELTIAKRLTKN